MVVTEKSPTSPGAPGARGAAPFDVEAATLFLRAQASWLCRGLTQAADDPIAVRIVLGAHDATHGRWLSLIARVQRSFGSAVAEQLSRVYAFHGRVAGSLERGVDPLLEPDLAEQIRRVLAEHLRQVTEAAVDLLEQAASGHADTPPSQ